MNIWKFTASIVLASGIASGKPLVSDENTDIFPAAQAEILLRAACYNRPEATSFWTPEAKDLEGIEDSLIEYLRSQKDEQKKEWSQYRRQIVGIRRGEQLLIFISYSSFPKTFEEKEAKDHGVDYDPNWWKKAPYVVADGGATIFRVLYDLKSKRFVWYECNGSA